MSDKPNVWSSNKPLLWVVAATVFATVALSPGPAEAAEKGRSKAEQNEEISAIKSFIRNVHQGDLEANKLREELVAAMQAGKWEPGQRGVFLKKLGDLYASFEPSITTWERFDLSKVKGGAEAGKRMFVVTDSLLKMYETEKQHMLKQASIPQGGEAFPVSESLSM